MKAEEVLWGNGMHNKKQGNAHPQATAAAVASKNVEKDECVSSQENYLDKAACHQGIFISPMNCSICHRYRKLGLLVN